MSDCARRRRIANAIAVVALIVLLVLVGLALRFETKDERPGREVASSESWTSRSIA